MSGLGGYPDLTPMGSTVQGWLDFYPAFQEPAP